MNERSHDMRFAGPGVMLVSAAIFAYFGFMMNWNHTSVITGQFLLFVALLDWTLKGAAIGFLAAAVLTFVKPLVGNFMYSAISLLTAIMFVVVAIMDVLDKQHNALHPFLLLIFAAWNGFGSWQGIQECLRARRQSPAASTGAGPWQSA